MLCEPPGHGWGLALRVAQSGVPPEGQRDGVEGGERFQGLSEQKAGAWDCFMLPAHRHGTAATLVPVEMEGGKWGGAVVGVLSTLGGNSKYQEPLASHLSGWRSKRVPTGMG